MTKRVYRYFFDFKEGQERWLNKMAAEGYRLAQCNQLSYDFEPCQPGEYEYAVEFVAHKSYPQSKDYRAFLESLGYRTLYKNINVGIFVGKVRWRPWGEGLGQIATAPGGYQKELLIVERRRDGTPFALHTSASDLLAWYKPLRNAYWYTAGSMFAMTAMCLALGFFLEHTVFTALGAALTAACGAVLLLPARRCAVAVLRLREEASMQE